MPSAEELYDEGLEAFRRGDQEQSKRLNEQALEQATADGDDLNVARALIGLARIAFRDKDHQRLSDLAHQCQPIYSRLPDKLAVTSPIHMLAESCRMHGLFDEARRHYQANIEEATALGGTKRVRGEKSNLALLEVATGNYETALTIASDLLPGVEDDMERTYVLLAFGSALAGLGRSEEARLRLEECSALLAKQSIVLDPADQPVFDEAMARVATASVSS